MPAKIKRDFRKTPTIELPIKSPDSSRRNSGKFGESGARENKLKLLHVN